MAEIAALNPRADIQRCTQGELHPRELHPRELRALGLQSEPASDDNLRFLGELGWTLG
ncbi:MAG: hypothetical protein ACK5RC_02850 [Curvibacter sp.]|nr:hypothetical protein [Curvibacter sp.]